MSFPLYLLILSLLPYFSTSSYPYGIIRNASIEIPFDIPADLGHQSEVRHCNQCLCEAFSNSDKVYLFTCTGNESESFICQFYYFMPKRDEIKSPRNNTNIYLIKNETFEEKDDCCNTTYLMEQINNVGPHETFSAYPGLRFLVKGDNDTIAAADSQQLHKFDRSTLDHVFGSAASLFSTVGYSDKKYYLNVGQNIGVYNETLNSLYTITLNRGTLTTIRFLNETQMLVGVGDNNKGVYICTKTSTIDKFIGCNLISGTDIGQVHALGVVNENAFYVGWDEPGKDLVLYTKDQTNLWKITDTITHSAKTSDIVVDRCKRIWAVEANGNQIYIYDQNKTRTGPITVGAMAFNLLIFENYTLVISHGSGTGLSRIKPSVNCRPPR